MIKKMSNKQYHASSGLSKSMMDKLKISPAHFKYLQDNPEEQTEAMLVGSLLHTLVLEPKLFDKEYAVLPVLDRRTSAGKQAYAEFVEQNQGKNIVTQEQLELANTWAKAIKQHVKAKEFLKPKTGKNEVSIFWTDKETGELCKARPDRIFDDYIIDLKTAVSSQQDAFQRKAYDLGYYRQAAWFMEAFRQEFAKEPKGFIIIAVEKSAPYNVVVYQFDQFAIEIGDKENRQLLNTYHECKELGDWYGYDGPEPTVQSLGLPNYVIARNMEEL